MIPIRKVFNDDQVLMLASMISIAAMVIVALVVLAAVPEVNGSNVGLVVGLGVAAIASFTRQPAFPAAPITPPGATGATGAVGETGKTGDTGASGTGAPIDATGQKTKAEVAIEAVTDAQNELVVPPPETPTEPK